MSDKSNMAATLLGVPVAMSCQGRLVISRSGGSKPSKKSGLIKYTIAGVGISDMDIKNIDGDWSMVECDIIIVPKRLHKKFTMADGMSIGQLLTGGYENPDYWKIHESIKVK